MLSLLSRETPQPSWPQQGCSPGTDFSPRPPSRGMGTWTKCQGALCPRLQSRHSASGGTSWATAWSLPEASAPTSCHWRPCQLPAVPEHVHGHSRPGPGVTLPRPTTSHGCFGADWRSQWWFLGCAEHREDSCPPTQARGTDLGLTIQPALGSRLVMASSLPS